MFMTAHTRAKIKENNEKYKYCSLYNNDICDDDVDELIRLFSINTHIATVDLDRNPNLTKVGLNKPQAGLTRIEFINADCNKSIVHLLEQNTLTYVQPRGCLVSIITFFRETDEENSGPGIPDKSALNLKSW